MPRQNRRRAEPGVVVPGTHSVYRRDSWRGEEYIVRALSGAGRPVGRSYRCPGCDQLIGSRDPHVVAWPADDAEATDRRHWHTACWAAREHRTAAVQRGRSAPRY